MRNKENTMLAILFLILCAVWGYELVTTLVPDTRRLFVASATSSRFLSIIPDTLFTIPAGLLVGITTMTVMTYIFCHLSSFVMGGTHHVQSAGLLLSSSIALIGIISLMTRKYKLEKTNLESSNGDSVKAKSKLTKFDASIKNTIFYGLCIVFFTVIASFLFFYTYRTSDGLLYAGHSVFSDLAPHTAMISSFGVGENFPTQYMHYASDGIQYHFFFYFFCGLLQYLGLSIDFALNITSIIGMVSCFTLIGLIGLLLSGRRLTFVLPGILVLFRSGLNAFMAIKSLVSTGVELKDAISTLSKSIVWFNQTPYDDWGIWAINVYPNQRHLLFGVALVALLVILFLPNVRRMFQALHQKASIKTFLFTRNSWLPRREDPLSPYSVTLLALIVIVLMPYFHGSALIAGLLILAGMAIISENRLSYLVVAVGAIISSFVQTRLFSGSYTNVVSFKFVQGFVSPDTTAEGCFNYLMTVCGPTLLVATLFSVGWLIKDLCYRKPIYRSLLFVCFLLPLIFAFNFQVSLEMLANHKYIQISLIFLDILVSIVLSNLFVLPLTPRKSEVILPTLLPLPEEMEEKTASTDSSTPTPSAPAKSSKNPSVPLPCFVILQIISVIIACTLLLSLTLTGIFEWCVYYNINEEPRYLVADTNSELVSWMVENTDEGDVFLTPPWSFNRFFLAGRPSYYAWPYYAWSAGHDTDTRLVIYEWLLTGCHNDINEFRRYCQERNIRYLIYDNEFNFYQNAFGEYIFNSEFFASNLTQVAYFPNDNNTIVYQIY